MNRQDIIKKLINWLELISFLMLNYQQSFLKILADIYYRQPTKGNER